MHCWVRTNWLYGEIAICIKNADGSIGAMTVSSWPEGFKERNRAGQMSNQELSEACKKMVHDALNLAATLRILGCDVGALEQLT